MVQPRVQSVNLAAQVQQSFSTHDVELHVLISSFTSHCGTCFYHMECPMQRYHLVPLDSKLQRMALIRFWTASVTSVRRHVSA